MRLFPGSRTFYNRQVVDANIRLNGIIRFTIPFARFFYEVQIVSEAQFPVRCLLYLVDVMDDNLASDIRTVLEPFA